MSTTTETFDEILSKNIRAKLSELHKNGTTAISEMNLEGIVQTPDSRSLGAPSFNPAAYHARFLHVLRCMAAENKALGVEILLGSGTATGQSSTRPT